MTRDELSAALYADAVRLTAGLAPLIDTLLADGIPPWEIDAVIDAVVLVLKADMMERWAGVAATIE